MRRAIAPAALLIATVVGQVATWTRPTLPPMLEEDELPHDPVTVADAPATIAELRERVAAVLEREGVPGVGLALVDRDGPRWVGGVGEADATTHAPVTADTVFRVASITKLV